MTRAFVANRTPVFTFASQDGPVSAQHEIGMWFTEVRKAKATPPWYIKSKDNNNQRLYPFLS